MLNEQGFYRPTFNEIVSAKSQKAKEIFGDDVDVSELTPLGKFIRINAYDLSKAYEDLEATYYARFPNTAMGISLDRLAVFAGIRRNPATYNQQKVKVYGVEGAEFPAMSLNLRGDNAEITFYNITDITINEAEGDNYYAEGVFQCAYSGTIGNVQINSVVNPTAEISSVSFLETIADGEERESDTSLRRRFSDAVKGAGNSNADSIRAAVLRVPTVASAFVVENDTNSLVSGRPAHSFEVYVDGGVGHEFEIAKAIFAKKPIGIQSVSTSSDSSITETIIDDSGEEHTISFSRVASADLEFSITYTGADSVDTSEIKTNIANYINSLGVGEDVVVSRLYQIVYSADGVDVVNSLEGKLKDTGSWETGVISISTAEVAHVDADDISITEAT